MREPDTLSTEICATGQNIWTPCPARPCYGSGIVDMTPNQLMKANVKALLKLRDKTPDQLARHCHNSTSWIDKIFREDRREFPTKYYLPISKFLGVQVYQLFQPGIADNAERRSGNERRKVIDRRVSRAVISEKALDVDLIHVVRAMSHAGRQKAIGLLMDILNDELRALRGTPATGAAAAGSSRSDETPTPKPVRTPRESRRAP